jgi:hypothetical protein
MASAIFVVGALTWLLTSGLPQHTGHRKITPKLTKLTTQYLNNCSELAHKTLYISCYGWYL